MRITPYIKFLFTSTNAHGVHSPFVFDLVQKCFYAKELNPKRQSSKKEQLLYRLAGYFKPGTIYTNSITSSEAQLLSTVSVITNELPAQIQFTYIKNRQDKTILNTFKQLLPAINNNSILVVENIHSSAEMENAWKTIKNNPSVSVTVDTFTLGLAFFRNEQQKEHFVIRPRKSVLLDFVLGIPKLWGMLS